MQEITAWLHEPDYATGVKLYQQYGPSQFLKLKFIAGPLPGNLERLRTELQKLVPQAAIASVTEIPEKVTKLPAPEPAPNPRKYLELLKRKERLYLELNELMAQKHHLPEGDELRDCALGILSRHQQLTETWALIDYYQEHQTFPAEPVPLKRDIDPEREIQQLRVSISKAKSRLLKANCRNADKTRSTLQASETRLAELLNLRTTDEQ